MTLTFIDIILITAFIELAIVWIGLRHQTKKLYFEMVEDIYGTSPAVEALPK